MPQLLLELFSEEIPARMQGNAARDLERMARERLAEAGFADSAIRTFAGPRRLTLVVDGLPAAQADRSEELKGPKAGAPPQAMEGFLRKVGLTQEQLVERDGVWFATVSSKGKGTADLIAPMVDQIVRNFPWPKSMKWGTCTLKWVRPLQRILCLFDGTVVPLDIEGIKSGDLSEGHRFMGAERGAFSVRDFDTYRAGLASRYVVLEADERKRRILDGARAACAARGLELVEDEGLLEEVSGLAEWPVPILGDMDPSFLDLPPEVIRTSMRTHQKYFAVRDPKAGRLAPHFLVVANIEASDGGAALAAGNARVLSARLNDARFFWDEDNKPGNFDRWLGKLKGVTFHAKLGTMADRVERIAALASEIAPLVGADPAVAEMAARLAKADLASGMVGEFPELQGLMGGYYARAAKLDNVVADAIHDHYRPQGPNDVVPSASVSVSVALADKLDTLVSFFAIDEKPTGSRDPYALRRAALGAIRIILENGVRAPLDRLLSAALAAALESESPLAAERFAEHLSAEGYTSTGREGSLMADLLRRGISDGWDRTRSSGSQETEFFDGQRLLELESYCRTLFPPHKAFFADRLKVQLRDEGKRHDLVDAVFALGDDDLVRIVARVEALDKFLATEDGANLLAGYKRAANILRSEEKKGPLPEAGRALRLPGAPAQEITLVAALTDATPKVETALAAEDFAAAMTALAALRKPVDAFFEDVMVNSSVPAERDNRLRLLIQVRDLMGRVADFSQISR